jgi:hypothetical protein
MFTERKGKEKENRIAIADMEKTYANMDSGSDMREAMLERC